MLWQVSDADEKRCVRYVNPSVACTQYPKGRCPLGRFPTRAPTSEAARSPNGLRLGRSTSPAAFRASTARFQDHYGANAMTSDTQFTRASTIRATSQLILLLVVHYESCMEAGQKSPIRGLRTNLEGAEKRLAISSCNHVAAEHSLSKNALQMRVRRDEGSIRKQNRRCSRVK